MEGTGREYSDPLIMPGFTLASVSVCSSQGDKQAMGIGVYLKDNPSVPRNPVKPNDLALPSLFFLSERDTTFLICICSV